VRRTIKRALPVAALGTLVALVTPPAIANAQVLGPCAVTAGGDCVVPNPTQYAPDPSAVVNTVKSCPSQPTTPLPPACWMQIDDSVTTNTYYVTFPGVTNNLDTGAYDESQLDGTYYDAAGATLANEDQASYDAGTTSAYNGASTGTSGYGTGMNAVDGVAQTNTVGAANTASTSSGQGSAGVGGCNADNPQSGKDESDWQSGGNGNHSSTKYFFHAYVRTKARNVNGGWTWQILTCSYGSSVAIDDGRGYRLGLSGFSFALKDTTSHMIDADEGQGFSGPKVSATLAFQVGTGPVKVTGSVNVNQQGADTGVANTGPISNPVDQYSNNEVSAWWDGRSCCITTYSQYAEGGVGNGLYEFPMSDKSTKYVVSATYVVIGCSDYCNMRNQ